MAADSDLLFQPAHRLRDLMDDGEVSAAEIAAACRTQGDQVEPQVQAYLAAAEGEQTKVSGEDGPEKGALAGIPVALKDNMCTHGVPTTCASRILEDFVPPYDAAVVERLRQAGAVMTGKTNMDEFAMGSSTENSAFQTTHNPWDAERVPGGSSGGSAAAVASGQAVMALGSDTGGSIRQPAAFCGVVGMKPTYGAVSRYGLVAFASSLDQIGPFTLDVHDCALVLNVICGHDARDSTSVDTGGTDYTEALQPDIGDLTIGIPEEYVGEGIDPGVRQAVDGAIDRLGELGADCTRVSLPHTPYATAAYYIVATAEASSNLARYDGVRYGLRAGGDGGFSEMFGATRQQGFGPEVKRRIMLGTYALSAGYYDDYYLKALKVRTLIRRDFEQAFEDVDLLVTPTAPETAFRIGDNIDDPLSMYLCDVCTVPVNLAGLPALSLPCGFVEGLPVGLQLIGPHFAEKTVLRAAYTYEQATGGPPLMRRRPALAGGEGAA